MNTQTVAFYAILVAIFSVPLTLLVIWSLNTLFPVLEIQYTWQSCIAVIALVGAVRGYRWS